MEEITSLVREKMNKTLDVLSDGLASVRTGRAAPSLLGNIKVEAYGGVLSLRDLASINAPEPRLLVVSPWDSSLSELIAKAIRNSNLGLSPASDSGVIRVPIPPLTEERRRDYLKIVSQTAENAKISTRLIRREATQNLDKLEKSGKISEDENKRYQERIQELTDQTISKISNQASNKEKELMEL